MWLFWLMNCSIFKDSAANLNEDTHAITDIVSKYVEDYISIWRIPNGQPQWAVTHSLVRIKSDVFKGDDPDIRKSRYVLCKAIRDTTMIPDQARIPRYPHGCIPTNGVHIITGYKVKLGRITGISASLPMTSVPSACLEQVSGMVQLPNSLEFTCTPRCQIGLLECTQREQLTCVESLAMFSEPPSSVISIIMKCFERLLVAHIKASLAGRFDLLLQESSQHNHWPLSHSLFFLLLLSRW